MKVGKENYAHAMSVKSFLEAETNENLGYHYGYIIYKWCHKNDNLKNMNPKIQNFWVVKKSHLGFSRGQKIMKRSEMENFVNNGGKVREIFCHDKQTRKLMNELNSKLSNLQYTNQHGFIKNRDIFTNFRAMSQYCQRNNFTGSFASIDLSDAFNQISYEQVYSIFRFIFELNSTDAQELSDKCCMHGHLFQGNVLAPFLFNIWSLRIYAILTKFKGWNQNFTVYNYADDFTILVKYHTFSMKFLRIIHKVLNSIGFKTNKAKSKIGNSQNLESCGLCFRHNDGDMKVQPSKGMKKLKNNLRLWNHLESIGIESTKRVNKVGSQIFLTDMKNGLENWYNRLYNFQPIS